MAEDFLARGEDGLDDNASILALFMSSSRDSSFRSILGCFGGGFDISSPEESCVFKDSNTGSLVSRRKHQIKQIGSESLDDSSEKNKKKKKQKNIKRKSLFTFFDNGRSLFIYPRFLVNGYDDDSEDNYEDEKDEHLLGVLISSNIQFPLSFLFLLRFYGDYNPSFLHLKFWEFFATFSSRFSYLVTMR